MKIRLIAYLNCMSLFVYSCSTPQNLVSEPLPSSSATPSPTIIESPATSPSPTINTSPEPFISATPVPVPPQLSYISENNLATRLFSIDSETGTYLAWQTQSGETKLFDGNVAKTILPSTKYEVVNPMFGYVNAVQQGLLLVREETRLNHPSDPNPGNSHAITLQGSKAINEALLSKLQIRALGINSDGNGYVLLSNEYRLSLSDKNIEDYPNVAVYSSKVTDFTVGQPELLFETEFKNARAEQIISDASIKPDGSGFVLLPSDINKSGTALQKFNQNRELFEPQIVPKKPGTDDYYLSNPTNKERSFLTKIQTEIKDRNTTINTLEIHSITNNQLTGQTFRLPAPDISVSYFREDYSLAPYDFKLDQKGNGIFVSVKRDEKKMSDIVLLRKVKGFAFEEPQEFVYPNHAAIIDLKLMLDKQGTGKIIMIEGKCSSEKRCSTFFPENEKMQLSYLKVRDFAMD